MVPGITASSPGSMFTPGDPVSRPDSDRTAKPRRTGYPAGACHRARRRRDPVAGHDDQGV